MAETPGADDLLARVEALREAGAAERDPVRFAYLEALSRRVATQPPAIRDPLLAKLEGLADELAYPMPRALDEPLASSASPLADLLRHIGQHTQPATPAIGQRSTTSTVNPEKRPKSASVRGAKTPELKAVAIFRDAWSKLSAAQQLTQTLAQAPENAGPMNSQHLVLRSLELMRDLAPDYLQGFMSYIDTLIWLDQADPSRPAAPRTAPAKPVTPRKKAAKR